MLISPAPLPKKDPVNEPVNVPLPAKANEAVDAFEELIAYDDDTAKLDVPNKLPVKLLAVTLPLNVLGPLTVKLPVIVTEPVNCCVSVNSSPNIFEPEE